MERTGNKPAIGIQLKVLACLAVVLVAFAAVGTAGGVVRSREQGVAAASEKAAALADQMDAVWDYIEGHQDIVAEVAEADGETPGANGYVCIVSAKAVAERFSDSSTTSIRYTSLRPRNTLDAADDFERTAMELFSANPSALAYESVVTGPDGAERYRYLRPIRIEKTCLTCHGSPAGELDWLGYAKEGYAIGDLVGAVSISAPMTAYYAASWGNVAGWLVLLVIGLVIAGTVIYALLNVTVLKPVAQMSTAVRAYREGDISHRIADPHGSDEVAELGRDFNAMAQELQDLYGGLEQRVEQRTAELQNLNSTLSEMLTDQQQNLELAVERLRSEREAMAKRALEPVRVGAFEFDPAKFVVTKRGQAISLTPKEFNILFTLACRSDEVVSQRELVQAAWGEGYTEEMAGLAVYVRRIRKKIEDDPADPQFLQTCWGEGYRFATRS